MTNVMPPATVNPTAKQILARERMSRWVAKVGKEERNRRNRERERAKRAKIRAEETPEEAEQRKLAARIASAKSRAANPEKTKRAYTIRRWKKWEVDPAPYASLGDLYDEKYLLTLNCEECEIVLTTDDSPMTATTRCMDHDHDTKLFRGIVCNGCNIRRGYVDRPPRPRMSDDEALERQRVRVAEKRKALGKTEVNRRQRESRAKRKTEKEAALVGVSAN